MRQELLNLIVQKPIVDPKHRNFCPHCNSDNIQVLGRQTTLLGVESLNHVWVESRCKDCGERYCMQYKGNHVWYQGDGKDPLVLKGVHHCFEEATYTCKNCDGTIKRMYTDLEGNPVNSLYSRRDETGKLVKQYYEIWYCDTCDKELKC